MESQLAGESEQILVFDSWPSAKLAIPTETMDCASTEAEKLGGNAGAYSLSKHIEVE